MISFSAFLVVVAVGLLVAGVVTSKLVLIYAAIGVSGVALLALTIGAAVKWRVLFDKPKTAASAVGLPEPAPVQAVGVQAPQAQSGLQALSRPSAAGGSSAGRATAAALRESAVPPTGTFPGGQASAPDAPGTPGSAAASPAAQAPPNPAPATTSASPGAPEPSPTASQPAATVGTPTSPAAGSPSVAEGTPASVTPETAPEPESSHATPRTVVTVVPGVPRYHSVSCLLIRFMGEDDLEKTTIVAAREAGCTPCRACLPDKPPRVPE